MMFPVPDSYTAHQPEIFPWVGWLAKLYSAEYFLLLDDVQFNYRYFQHRNRFVDARGKDFWLTVPIIGRKHIPIKDVRISEDLSPLVRKLTSSYRLAPFFEEYAPTLFDILLHGYRWFIDLALPLLNFWCETFLRFPLENRLTRSSSLGLPQHPTLRLVQAGHRFRANLYLAGTSGAQYLDVDEFRMTGIAVATLRTNPAHPALAYGAPHYLFTIGPDITSLLLSSFTIDYFDV